MKEETMVKMKVAWIVEGAQEEHVNARGRSDDEWSDRRLLPDVKFDKDRKRQLVACDLSEERNRSLTSVCNGMQYVKGSERMGQWT